MRVSTDLLDDPRRLVTEHHRVIHAGMVAPVDREIGMAHGGRADADDGLGASRMRDRPLGDFESPRFDKDERARHITTVMSSTGESRMISVVSARALIEVGSSVTVGARSRWSRACTRIIGRCARSFFCRFLHTL